MNRHTKQVFVTILLGILLGISSVISVTVDAGAIMPGPGQDTPPALTIQNP